MKPNQIFILFALSLLIILPIVYAEDSYQDMVASQAGIDQSQIDQLQNLPTTPEEAKDQYLKQSVSELIQNNVYLGPVHRFFITLSPVFMILFGENYSLSPTLLLIICLWFFVLIELTTFLNGLSLLNNWANIGIGAASSIILAQIGVYRGICTALYNLVYADRLWYVRIIGSLAVFVALFVLHYILKKVEVDMKNAKKTAKENAIADKVQTQEKFIQGLKTGSKLSD